MRKDTLSPDQKVAELRHSLAERYGTHAFDACQSMGDLTATLIRLMVEG
jgi:hypothetical protein